MSWLRRRHVSLRTATKRIQPIAINDRQVNPWLSLQGLTGLVLSTAGAPIFSACCVGPLSPAQQKVIFVVHAKSAFRQVHGV